MFSFLNKTQRTMLSLNRTYPPEFQAFNPTGSTQEAFDVAQTVKQQLNENLNQAKKTLTDSQIKDYGYAHLIDIKMQILLESIETLKKTSLSQLINEPAKSKQLLDQIVSNACDLIDPSFEIKGQLHCNATKACIDMMEITRRAIPSTFNDEKNKIQEKIRIAETAKTQFETRSFKNEYKEMVERNHTPTSDISTPGPSEPNSPKIK